MSATPLYEARKHWGLSREKVGAALGISSKTVERHERPGYPVKLIMLVRYAELYKVTVDELLNALSPETREELKRKMHSNGSSPTAKED